MSVLSVIFSLFVDCAGIKNHLIVNSAQGFCYNYFGDNYFGDSCLIIPLVDLVLDRKDSILVDLVVWVVYLVNLVNLV